MTAASRPTEAGPTAGVGQRHPARDSGKPFAVPHLDRVDLWLIAVILFAALLLRLTYVREIAPQPEFSAPEVDAGYHDYWGWGLVSGDWTPAEHRESPRISSTPYFRPPLCPYFLAGVYAVVGHHYFAARLVQALIGSAACALAYLICRRLFDRVSAALCGLMMAGYWVFIYFDSELREVVLLVFLLQLAVLLLLMLRWRPGLWPALGCGIALGLACLGRPNVLLSLPVAVIWLWVVQRRTVPRLRLTACVVGLIGGATLVVAPVTIRNAVAGNDFVLISSNGGINLYIGNNPLATGHDVRLPDDLPEFATAFHYPPIVRYVESLEGRSLKHSEVSAHFRTRALQHLREDPARYAGLLLKKAAMFWGGPEIVSERDLNFARGESKLLSALPGSFAGVLAMGVVGLALALFGRAKAFRWPARADVALIVLLVAVYFATFLPFFVTARYRVPITPFVIMFGAFGLVRLFGVLRQRRPVPVLAALVLMGGLYTVNGVDYFGVTADAFEALYARAAAASQNGRHAEAVTWYSRALAIRPGEARAHNNLGIELATLGDVPGALEHYAAALNADPDYAEARNNFGIELMNLGQVEDAVVHFERAVAKRPEFLPARRNLALAFAVLQRYEDAVEQYRTVLKADPDDAGAHYNLAVVLERMNQPAAAAAEYRETLRCAPDHARARQALARLAANP